MIVVFILNCIYTQTLGMLLPDKKGKNRNLNKRIYLQLKIGSISSAHQGC